MRSVEEYCKKTFERELNVWWKELSAKEKCDAYSVYDIVKKPGVIV